MKTHFLEIDYDEQFAFELIGLRSSKSDFQLAWSLNLHLRWDLERRAEVVISHPHQEMSFARFDYENEEDQIMISLVQNRIESGCMLPEWPQFDYLLKIENERWTSDDYFFKRLRDIPFVQMAFPLATDKLKTRQNLIFWEYAPPYKKRNEKNENSSDHWPRFSF